MTSRIAWSVLLAILVSCLAVPQASAQAAANTLYFTDTLVRTAMPPEVNEEDPGCPVESYYAATTSPPPAGQTYTGLAVVAGACYVHFDYVAPSAFTFTTDIGVNALIDCTAPTAIIEVDANVFAGPDEIVNGGDDFVAFIPPAVCTPGSPVAVTIPVLGSAGFEIAAGMTLSTRIVVFGESPPDLGAGVGNTFIVTGTPASALVAGGIPGPGVVGAEAIDLAVGDASAGAAPGADAFFNLTVTNVGGATEYTLSTSGLPEGYGAAFNPLSGSLAANATADAVLKVTIPDSATAGTAIPFTVTVTSTAGANKTVELTLDVLQRSVSSSTTSGTTSDGFTSETTSQAAPGFELLANVLAVGLAVVAMRRRVA